MLSWVRLFIMIAFLQTFLSCATSRFTPMLQKSAEITCSHVFFGLPLPLLPSTSITLHRFTQLLSSILSTWQPRCMTLLLGCNWNLSSSSFDDFPSLTCGFQRSMLISVRCNLAMSSSFAGHVSLPYSITDRTHASYNSPFLFKEKVLEVKSGNSSRNFFHALLVRVIELPSDPPAAPACHQDSRTVKPHHNCCCQ